MLTRGIRGRTRLNWGKRNETWLIRSICRKKRYKKEIKEVYEGKRDVT